MKPFHHATIVQDPEKDAALIQHMMVEFGVTEPEATAQLEYARSVLTVMNDRYQVSIEDDGPYVHLSIKRLDKEPIHDWRDLQHIKNMLVGTECEGLELYPAESRVVDTANQYHLWVLKDPCDRVPVGYNPGIPLRCETEIAGIKQRQFKKGGQP